jgi:hypothetical protein
MSTQRIDLINIGLMLLSVLGALTFPFQLFLFAYIVLGPLHYLTEIGWLNERRFFMPGKRDVLWLVALCLLTGGGYLALHSAAVTSGAGLAARLGPHGLVVLRNLLPGLTFLAFFAALAMVLFQRALYRLLTVGVGVAIALALFNAPFYIVVFGIFVPTLIHTTVFTGAFIVQGALRGRSTTGYLSFAAFVLCSLSFFVVDMNPVNYAIPKVVQKVFLDGQFFQLNYALYHWVFHGGQAKFVLDSPLGLRIQGFIAFAYTYHYLNWFSKTEVIKWHTIPRPWLAGTIVVWLASIGLYLYDVRLGISALIFLSLMHTFLEFPLNHRSFIGIGAQMKRRLHPVVSAHARP